MSSSSRMSALSIMNSFPFDDELEDFLTAAQDLGFDELLEDEGLTVIEWSQFIPGIIPDEYLSVAIHLMDEDRRELVFEAHGADYEALLEEIA